MASTDLLFSDSRIVGSPTHLVFGGESGPVVPTILKADIYVTLSGSVTVSSGVMQPVKVAVSVVLDGTVEVVVTGVMPVRAEGLVRLCSTVTVTAATFYDNRVTGYLDSRAASPFQTAIPNVVELDSAWSVSLPQKLTPEMRWKTALPMDTVAGLSFDISAPVLISMDALWQLAVQSVAQAKVVQQTGVLHSDSTQGRYERADQLHQQSASVLQTGVFQAKHHTDTWQWAQAKVHNLSDTVGASVRRSGLGQFSFPWQLAGQAKNGKSVLPEPEVPVVPMRDGHLLFECPPLTGFPLHLIFGAQACYLQPSTPGTVVVPVLRTYVTVNSIALRRVSDGLPISAFGFGMSLDWQSWTWSWSASIPASQLPLVRPGSSGEPIEFEALVNGVPYRLCVEGLDRQRTFAKGRIGVKGRGTAAILDQPYAPVLNFGNAGPRTAQQLMSDALTINGVGIGWDVDWGLTDWLVPGNAWTHQGTYISAILDIAGAAGGYVQPHATEQALRILPKYPEAPWNWADITPDLELPGIATVEGIDWQRKADYNSIHLSGISAGGVLRQVKREGTAGDSEEPMITHALITHSDAARQRGLAELSDTGKQAHVSLKLPVLEETGLIMPGKFVRYSNGSETHFGLTRSISLDWSRPVLRQTISVETHV